MFQGSALLHKAFLPSILYSHQSHFCLFFKGSSV